jgi:hypothetical protein
MFSLRTSAAPTIVPARIAHNRRPRAFSATKGEVRSATIAIDSTPAIDSIAPALSPLRAAT